jgi:hypothetical protein
MGTLKLASVTSRGTSVKQGILAFLLIYSILASIKVVELRVDLGRALEGCSEEVR